MVVIKRKILLSSYMPCKDRKEKPRMNTVHIVMHKKIMKKSPIYCCLYLKVLFLIHLIE